MGKTKLNLNSKVTVNQGVISRLIHDEEVILNLPEGLYFGLNDTATVIWQKIKENVPLTDIQEIVSDEFDVSPDDALDDILDLLSNLEKNSLVKIEAV